MAPLEAKRLHCRILGYPLSRCHCHRVCSDNHDDHDHDIRNNLDSNHNGFSHCDETELESFFRFGHCLGKRIPESRIDRLGNLRGFFRGINSDDIQSDLIGSPWDSSPQGFVQIVPLEEELAFISAPLCPPVYSPKHKIPLPREYCPFEYYPVANFPAMLCGQLVAGHRTPSIFEKTLFFSIFYDELRIEREKCFRFHRKIREKVLFGYVNASKPVHGAHFSNPGNVPDALSVGDWKGEYQRDRASCYQSCRGGCLDSEIPEPYQGTEESESKNSDSYSGYGQNCSERMPESIP